jgi:uncharacterized oxidoreductase
VPTFTPEELTHTIRAVLTAARSPREEADWVAQTLVHSNLMGLDSHGAIRVPEYVRRVQKGEIVPGARIAVERETPSSAVLNGNWGYGQMTAKRAAELAMEKARACTISCVGTHNSNHMGRIGEYTEMVARAGMIGIAMVNNHGGGQCMAPFGGRMRRLSPNPLSAGIPTGAGNPIVADVTSSVAAEGKVRVMRNKGARLPEGWIMDSQGRPSTDPNDFYGRSEKIVGAGFPSDAGALLPFGGSVGYKGFALALLVDILCGALTGAGCSREKPDRIGNALMMIVIDIQKLAPMDLFVQEVQGLIQYVKGTPLAPGFKEILLPGEPEQREEKKRRAGGIVIDDETWRQVREAAASVGVKA